MKRNKRQGFCLIVDFIRANQVAETGANAFILLINMPW
jgi:hypothetical protein